MDRFGHPRANPPRLTKPIIWCPGPYSGAPNADVATKQKCTVSFLWPLHMGQKPSASTVLPFKDIRAVAFGYNASVVWIWNDTGDSQEGESLVLEEESDYDDPADSGFGSSVRSANVLEPQGGQRSGSDVLTLKHEYYKIAVICALPKELIAIRALFDATHQKLSQLERDTYTYALGRLGNHNVVAACLPDKEHDMHAAFKITSGREKGFPGVKWYFVVGIGGGVPSKKHDIRLGDVVVSTGVIQHVIGKYIQKVSKFLNTRILQRPARSLMTAISSIRSDPTLRHDFLAAHIQHIMDLQPEYKCPGEDKNRLFPPHSGHEDGRETYSNCKGPEIARIQVHFSITDSIASGNQVIKDALFQDRTSIDPPHHLQLA
ncbi:hypothetical protein BDV12DRAFT_192128 [Aspergillus spectabilis]